MKAVLEATGGAVLVVAFAAFWLWFMPPAHAAEGCRGHWARASYYGAESGNRTASGLRFDGTQLIVAHKSLPFHTRVRFTYHGKSIVVPVEDRGPFIKGREFDLSRSAAVRIGMIRAGVANVCAEVLP